MLLRRTGVWRLGPGKALRLTKGITEKLFSGVYRCHHNFPTTQFCGKLPWDEHVRYEQHEQQTVAFLGHCRSLTCAVMTVILSIAYNGD